MTNLHKIKTSKLFNLNFVLLIKRFHRTLLIPKH